MKFNFGRSGSFEITGIKKVVVNVIKMNGNVKEKVEKTFVWELAHVKNGERWLKYEWGILDILKDAKMSVEDLKEFSNKAILDGASPLQIHDSIMGYMGLEEGKVWFSGDTCNVEINLTIIESREADQKERIRSLLEDATRLVDRAQRKVRRAERVEARIAGKSRRRGN